MKKFFIFLVFCAVTAGIAFAQATMTPGAWEMKSTVTSKNPQTGEPMKLGETTNTACLTAEFLAKEPYTTASIDQEKAKEKGATCSTSDFVREGNTASWKVSCVMADGSRTEMAVKNVVDVKNLTTEMDSTVTQGTQASSVHMSIVGSYVGECTDDMMKL
jgi:hypothetical protein